MEIKLKTKITSTAQHQAYGAPNAARAGAIVDVLKETIYFCGSRGFTLGLIDF